MPRPSRPHLKTNVLTRSFIWPPARESARVLPNRPFTCGSTSRARLTSWKPPERRVAENSSWPVRHRFTESIRKCRLAKLIRLPPPYLPTQRASSPARVLVMSTTTSTDWTSPWSDSSPCMVPGSVLIWRSTNLPRSFCRGVPSRYLGMVRRGATTPMLTTLFPE